MLVALLITLPTMATASQKAQAQAQDSTENASSVATNEGAPNEATNKEPETVGEGTEPAVNASGITEATQPEEASLSQGIPQQSEAIQQNTDIGTTEPLVTEEETLPSKDKLVPFLDNLNTGAESLPDEFYGSAQIISIKDGETSHRTGSIIQIPPTTCLKCM